MREFKFRAWDKDKKIMIYESATEYSKEPYNHYVFAILNNTVALLYYSHFDADEFIVVNSIIMQYTGLKDKSGVEIYEGDIIEFYDEYVDGTMSEEVNVEEVEFDDCGFSPLANQFYTGNNIEVIGNIYENPELLEV